MMIRFLRRLFARFTGKEVVHFIPRLPIASVQEMYDELYEALQLIKGKSSYDGDEFSIQAKSIQELLNRIDGTEIKS